MLYGLRQQVPFHFKYPHSHMLSLLLMLKSWNRLEYLCFQTHKSLKSLSHYMAKYIQSGFWNFKLCNKWWEKNTEELSIFFYSSVLAVGLIFCQARLAFNSIWRLRKNSVMSGLLKMVFACLSICQFTDTNFKWSKPQTGYWLYFDMK